MNSIFSVNHVSFSYHTMQGETPALSDITFQVKPGEFLAIVGPSGCGNAMFHLRKQFFRQPPILN